MTYTETETEISDIVTLRLVKSRNAKSVYFNAEVSPRIELPLDTPLKMVYNKETKRICIEPVL